MPTTLKVTSLSGRTKEEREYPNALAMMSGYNDILHGLQVQRFELDKDIIVLESPTDNLVAYRSEITGDVECVTADLFYRRFYKNKDLVQKVKSITGD